MLEQVRYIDADGNDVDIDDGQTRELLSTRISSARMFMPWTGEEGIFRTTVHVMSAPLDPDGGA